MPYDKNKIDEEAEREGKALKTTFDIHRLKDAPSRHSLRNKGCFINMVSHVMDKASLGVSGRPTIVGERR